jgi:hypothetical protein
LRSKGNKYQRHGNSNNTKAKPNKRKITNSIQSVKATATAPKMASEELRGGGGGGWGVAIASASATVYYWKRYLDYYSNRCCSHEYTKMIAGSPSIPRPTRQTRVAGPILVLVSSGTASHRIA